MPRQLDLTALRSFVTVADLGGVTRASGALNLTQSAVSMQLKRLEESLGTDLLDRTARRIALTASGEQLLGYARRILTLNDEAWERMTDDAFEGEIKLGVPHDIVYPVIPRVLRGFGCDYPRVRITLAAEATLTLKEKYARGEIDVILTTETDVDAGGVTVAQMPLIWVGAEGGNAWRDRPLPLAFERRCIFRQGVQRRLDEAGIDWTMAVEADSSRAVGAMVTADLAVHTVLERFGYDGFTPIPHGKALPELETYRVNLYARRDRAFPAIEELSRQLHQAYAAL